MPKVIYETRDRIAYVSLNRPEAKNAIDDETNELLWRSFEAFRDDPDVDVAIVTGVGDAFCAGADLKTFIPAWMDASAWRVRQNVATGIGGITRGLHRISKPIIAAVNGWALAAGFELALACDIRIASEAARFGSFEARRGFHHMDGGIARLVNIVGTGLALEMVLTAEPIDAWRAEHYHLVSRVVPADQLLTEAETVARQILRNSQHAVRSAKETILDMMGRSLDEQLRVEALNGYAAVIEDESAARLEDFYRRTDAGRAGGHR
jgi:enoyl-CoA hydratase/carnithine racemase